MKECEMTQRNFRLFFFCQDEITVITKDEGEDTPNSLSQNMRIIVDRKRDKYNNNNSTNNNNTVAVITLIVSTV